MSSAISVSCSPASPRVIAGRKPTATRASRAAASRRERRSGAEASTRAGVPRAASAARGGSAGAGLEVLLVLLTGRPQVDVRVEEGGQQPEPTASLDDLL